MKDSSSIKKQAVTSKRLAAILSMLCALLCLCSCDIYYDYYSIGYIARYHDIDNISLTQDGNFIYIKAKSHQYACASDKSQRLFRQTAREFGDTAYNKEITYEEGWPLFHPEAYRQRIQSIDITSDVDFDAEHPAGSDLGDIVTFYGQTLYPYVQSAYTDSVDWKALTEDYSHIPEMNDKVFRYLSRERCTHFINKKVSELGADDLTLLYYGYPYLGILEFASMPETTSFYTIKVKLCDAEGDTYTYVLGVEP